MNESSYSYKVMHEKATAKRYRDFLESWDIHVYNRIPYTKQGN